MSKYRFVPSPIRFLNCLENLHNSSQLNKIDPDCYFWYRTCLGAGMSRNANRNRTDSKALLSAAILLKMEKIKTEQRDRTLREKVEELAKTSLELYQRFDNPSQNQTDTPQLTKKWHELAHAIRKLSR